MALESPTLEPDILPDPAKVQLDALNTIVDPFDPPQPGASAWFPTAIGKSSPLAASEVIPYIDSSKAFADIVAAMRTITGPGHFMAIAAWNLDLTFPLITGDPTTTFAMLVASAVMAGGVATGAEARALLYHQQKVGVSGGQRMRDNQPAIDFFNHPAMPNAGAIHDARVVQGSFLVGIAADYAGAHHQKLIVINGAEGLVAFQGGCDLDPNRLTLRGAAGAELGGLHDVHTRVRGLAAIDLWQIFMERWTEHPSASAIEASKRLPPMAKQVTAPAAGELTVQVARTVPNSTRHALHGGGPPYAFAPTGDRSAKALVLHAIAQARRYIYLEDQYLVDMSISDALVAALPQVEKLIILIAGTASINGELREAWARRKQFVDPLIDRGAGKLSVCQLGAGRYVHAKTWIFDDKLAIVGSANVNRRGFTHDSEQTIGVFDEDAHHKLTFAHELRMNLWAKHTKLRPLDMLDPIAASVHWERPRPPSDVLPYDPEGGSDGATTPFLWDVGVDPDGS